MPLGQGVLPSGALGTQLTALTRRGYLPKIVVQVYNSSPLICALLDNAETEVGGVDPLTVNVQNAMMVLPQWTGFQGQFNAPTDLVGITPASWSMAMAVCPIPFYINELLIQSNQAIQKILDARFNDAGNAIRDLLAYALYNNTTNNNQLIGLPAAIDDGTVVATYGGINRSSNAYWQAKRYNAGNVSPTRALILQYLAGITKQQGEMPTFGVMNFGTWTPLAQDFLGLERYIQSADRETAYSAFKAIEIAGVPFYADPYCPEGTVYMVNTNYVTLRLHQQGQWEFVEFAPLTVVNQLGYIGVIYLLGQLINTKPKASGQVYNFTSLSI
jgi:hypothetical protein